MTARTPLETLSLARAYLDHLLADSTSGEWWQGDMGKFAHEVYAGEGMHDYSTVLENTRLEADAALIVALHAAAPAIRELLDTDITDIRQGMDMEYVETGNLVAALLSTPHAAHWITEREAVQ